MITRCTLFSVEDGRILLLARGGAGGFIAGDGDDACRSSRGLWRVFIFCLVSPKANTGGWKAQLYVRTEVGQNWYSLS